MKYPVKVSVVMPFFNAEGYIGTAIQSILNQTFKDFELILIDDGSNDQSLSIVKENSDPRMRLLKNTKRSGNYVARNIGIRAAVGKYICMMDADDISLKDRLLTQVQFLEKNTRIGGIGALSQIIDQSGKVIGNISRPLKYQTLKVNLLMDNQITQSTLMVRHCLIIKHYLFYNECLKYASDYDFVLRASQLFRIENINTVLLQYRRHKHQISQRKFEEQLSFANHIRYLQLEQLGLGVSEQQKQLHIHLMLKKTIKRSELPVVVNWFNKLLEANIASKTYNQAELFLFLKTLTMFYMKKTY